MDKKKFIFSELSIEDLQTVIIDCVNACLKNHNPISKETSNDTDEILTVQDTSKFLKLSVPTIYGLISKGKLPVMKRSKRCYFSKADLINYLKEGRKKTVSEIEAEAEEFINSKNNKS